MDTALPAPPVMCGNSIGAFRIEAVMPVGWEGGVPFPDTLLPPPNANLGELTEFTVGYNCDGRCKKKNGAPVIQRSSSIGLPAAAPRSSRRSRATDIGW